MQRTVPVERLSTNHHLAQDADLFRLMVDRVVDYAIFLLTPEGHVASWNAGAERLKGYLADEIIGQHFERFHTDEDRALGRPAQLLGEALRDGRVEDEGWRVRKDGTRFRADVVITALRDDEGTLRGFATITRDLTDRRAAEKVLSHNEQRFASLVDSIRDYAIFMLSPEGQILTWNQGAQRLKGYAPKDIIGHNFARFYTDEARASGQPQRLLASARADGRVEDEGWRVRQDGSRFWADVVITALRDSQGQLIGYAKVTRDLTDRRAAEDELRQSEQRFRTLVNSVKDYAIFMLSPEGTVLTWNRGAQMLKGYAPDEIIGRSFERFYTDEDRLAGHAGQLLALARTYGRVEDEGWRVRKDGSRFWADVVITTLTDDEGQLIGYAKVTRDLTQRKQAEQDRTARLAAERVSRRLARLQAATATLAAVTHGQQVAEVLTEVALQEVGAAAGVVAVPAADGAGLEVVAVRGYPSSLLQRDQQIAADDPYPLACAWRTNDALFLESRAQVQADYPELVAPLATSPFEAWVAIPLNIEQRPVGLLGVSFDRPRALDTDERGFLLALAEVGAQAIDRAHLYESERSARAEAEAAVRTQDEFLSVAAHELRTPVAAVKATAQLAERAIARGHLDAARLTGHLQTIARSSDRLAALIEDLLDVSRLRTGRLQLRLAEVDLGAMIQEIVSRYAATEKRHTFHLSAPNTPVVVDADPLRLEQVLDNLLSNAVKYSPNGGAIEVDFRGDADGVTIAVTDTGIGLPPGQEAHIFDAFGRASNATTRQIQGLGLGLAICREIVDVHGGRIWAASPGEGQGTTLSVWLPVVDVATNDGRQRG
ncbi:MAG TPA: PAS domain S-box protein [Chloroflexota bacterium]